MTYGRSYSDMQSTTWETISAAAAPHMRTCVVYRDSIAARCRRDFQAQSRLALKSGVRYRHRCISFSIVNLRPSWKRMSTPLPSYRGKQLQLQRERSLFQRAHKSLAYMFILKHKSRVQRVCLKITDYFGMTKHMSYVVTLRWERNWRISLPFKEQSMCHGLCKRVRCFKSRQMK